MAKTKPRTNSANRAILAGLLAWLLPGAGHYYLRHRGMAVVYFLAITFAYGAGLAIGGVKTSINPYLNRWLFLAELGTGGYTIAGYVASNQTVGVDARMTTAVVRGEPPFSDLSETERRALEDRLLPYLSFYPESDVAQIYLSIGGLLNLLAILDAITRAQTGGLPVFFPEMSLVGDDSAPGEEAT